MSLNTPSAHYSRRSRRLSSLTGTPHRLVCQPTENLTIAVERTMGHDVLSVTGEIDLATAPQLREVVRQVFEPGRHLVIDLDQVSFIDSSGLSILIATHRRAVAHGGSMTLVCNNARCMRVMQITGLSRVLTFAPSAAAASVISEGPSRIPHQAR